MQFFLCKQKNHPRCFLIEFLKKKQSGYRLLLPMGRRRIYHDFVIDESCRSSSKNRAEPFTEPKTMAETEWNQAEIKRLLLSKRYPDFNLNEMLRSVIPKGQTQWNRDERALPETGPPA